jgi:hypothetical protein
MAACLALSAWSAGVSVVDGVVVVVVMTATLGILYPCPHRR